ncbi:MAG: ATPase associated with various cellular 5 [Herbinix sp.]|nr:ATPase associated with various cellular 5 [Herbinix sp.]
MDADHSPLLSFDDIFNGDFSEPVLTSIQRETHTRLYLTAKNLLKTLNFRLKQDSQEAEYFINRLLEFLKVYP